MSQSRSTAPKRAPRASSASAISSATDDLPALYTPVISTPSPSPPDMPATTAHPPHYRPLAGRSIGSSWSSREVELDISLRQLVEDVAGVGQCPSDPHLRAWCLSVSRPRFHRGRAPLARVSTGTTPAGRGGVSGRRSQRCCLLVRWLCRRPRVLSDCGRVGVGRRGLRGRRDSRPACPRGGRWPPVPPPGRQARRSRWLG
jgi:hypothetical protein